MAARESLLQTSRFTGWHDIRMNRYSRFIRIRFHIHCVHTREAFAQTAT